MPNVEIVVEASLGDSLVKLDLAEHAVKDLGDAGESTSHHLRDFNSTLDDATIASHRAGAAIHDTERLIRDAEEAITGGAAGGSGGGGFTGAVANMALNLYSAVPAFSAFMNPMVLIPVLAIGASVAIVALADAAGTLIAILGDLVAPLTVVTGLLGLLAGGFFIAAQKAIGMHEDGLGQAISGLKKQFDDLTTTLVGRFMPVFQFLIHNASQALDFLNRIAKLPLDEAFRQLAQKGIPAVAHFLEQVGHMLAHPIRLAFQIAFGQGKAGNEASAAVSQIWNQLSNFLFGYSQTHKIHIGKALIVTQSEVQGIFQPLIDWFNRHDFTKQGIKIGHELLNGLKPFAGPITQFIVHIFEDAFKTVISNFATLIPRLIADWSPFGDAGKRTAREINAALTHELEDALNSAVGAAERVFNHIKGIFSSGVDLVVHVIADIPGVLQHLLGSGGGSSSSQPGVGSGRGAGSHNPGGQVMQVNHFHLSGAGSDAAFRRQVREIGRELDRQRHILAGGQ